VAGVKAALNTDKAQAKLGGYAGPYVRAEHKAAKEKNREELKKVWRAITKGPERVSKTGKENRRCGHGN
jgi:hypothetical protein